MFCPLYRSTVYAPYGAYDARCWSEGNRMPFSQFQFTPYRPLFPGPYVPGARQTPEAVLGNPYPCPVCPSGTTAQPGAKVELEATRCKLTGTITDGGCAPLWPRATVPVPEGTW
jgi:hypothetical protein